MYKNILNKNRFILLSTLMLILTSIMGCFMIFLRKYIIGDAWYSFLIWNLFLSWIPYFLSLFLYIMFKIKVFKFRNILFAGIGIIWIIFYPNLPYMVTDFIHIKNFDSVLMWYDFIVFSLFIYTSFFMGFVSIYIVFKIILKYYNIRIAVCFTTFMLLITSYGIYLGRFIRWNSWDIIFRPKALFESILSSINLNAIIFSLVFSLFLILVYGFLYFLTHLSEE
ncbi:MAG: DUF1361 domain-containing protein [Clostridiales bacterium]